MNFNNPIRRLAVIFLLAVGASAAAQDGLRQMLFEQAKDTLIQANQVQASVLAPKAYSEGAGHYKRAEELLERGGNLERIRSELSKAVAEWEKAITSTDVAKLTLANAIEARGDALSADAKNYAPEAWRDGEEAFIEATSRLESGSLRTAHRHGTRAETEFRAAELAAIKANYLNETEALLVRARKLRADRHAPATYANARALYTEAESELTANRYDTDRPRSLAQSAKHEAKLAIYLAQKLSAVERKRPELEALFLSWQTPTKEMGAALDTPVYFDDGYEESTRALVLNIEDLLKERRTLAQDLDERKVRIRGMEVQMAELERRLGGASKERLALAAELDHQARIKAKFERIEQMFGRDEAVVLRTRDNVILRLIGLTFDSGQSSISPERFALLRRVEQAINEFDQFSIEVEGHTDAFGSDENNRALSTERAAAVKAYMLANMGLIDSQVMAVGYGEMQPIANNETPEGRAKNRRIDIVIRPNL